MTTKPETTSAERPTSMYVVIAINGIGELKECVLTESLPLAQELRDALKGIWIGGTVAMLSRVVDEVPPNLIAEIDVMKNPPKPTGFIGGYRHG